MQQIADWLEKLGMSQYAERFAENRIDLSVLPDLTDQDLEKLGVLLGDRRKNAARNRHCRRQEREGQLNLQTKSARYSLKLPSQPSKIF
jgi:hypothetical protein